MGADNPGWVPPHTGAVRAWPAAVTLLCQARARKHGTDLGNCLTDQAFGLLGCYVGLAITGPQNAGKLPDCGAPARERITGLAGAGDAVIGTVILIRDHEYACGDQDAQRVREDPAAPVNVAGEMRYGLMEPEGWPMALTMTGHLTAVGCPAQCRVRRRRRDGDTAARAGAHRGPGRCYTGRQGGQPARLYGSAGIVQASGVPGAG